jgi:hypothetical protein
LILRAIDSKGSPGKDVHKRADGQKGNGVYIKEVEPPIPTPIWSENQRAGRIFTMETQNSDQFESVVEVSQNDSDPPRDRSQLPSTVTSNQLQGRATIPSVASPLAIQGRKRAKRRSIYPSRTKETTDESSIATEHNPTVVQNVSDGYFQDPRSLKRRNESSSTLFKNSPLAPVTIIVTTPEDEVQSPPLTPEPEPRNSFNAIRASRNASTTSLPATRFSRCFSTDSLPLPQPKMLDPTHLMPPIEHQINAQKLRKAQEFREIRKFLIHFMNAKGDQFPKKLRCRMMEAYAITESDLAPEVVARFNNMADIKDEGVALEQLGMNELENETTDAENLRILSMAFQSRIPVVTPSREVVGVDTIPPYNKNRPRQTNVSKPAPPLPAKAVKPIQPAELGKSIDDEPLNWLGPLISTTTSTTEWSLPLQDDGDRSRLTKAHSVPNMQRQPSASDSAPPMPSLPNSALSGSGRNNSLTEGGRSRGMSVEKTMHIARVRRQGIISGAFGAVREAMGGKKAGMGGEKRRLMRERK